MAVCGRQNIHHRWGVGWGELRLALGKLQVVCSSQTMLCLFIVEVSSQLAFPSLPQDHGQPGMLGENQLLFLVLCAPLILVCLSIVSLVSAAPC